MHDVLQREMGNDDDPPHSNRISPGFFVSRGRTTGGSHDTRSNFLSRAASSALEREVSMPGIAGALGVSAGSAAGDGDRQAQNEACRHAHAARLQQIANLPPEERRQIVQLVDAFIERGQLKRRATADN
jgi:hypothetical protein